MSHRLLPRSATSILVLVAGLVPLTADATGAESETTGDELPTEIASMVEWALGLFEEADMELPALEINHHGDDTAPCDGHDGLHRPGEGRSVIELCTDDVTFPTQAMVIHELAHAWVNHNVDEDTRNAFQELRGNEHWHDYDAAAWHENGTEQAAEIVAWGLFDRPMSMSRITKNSCDELEAGYRTLTGAAPLHGFRDLCG